MSSDQNTRLIMKMKENELTTKVVALLQRHGVEPLTAQAVAGTIVAAERDGTYSHGLARLPAFISTLKSGWVDPAAPMRVIDAAPGVVKVDAANGFAQGALARAAEPAIRKARSQGIACIVIHNSHHFGSLWPDVEPFAAQGLVTLAFLHSRARIVAPGGRKKILGTNPIAFGLPRKNQPPMVFDQAASPMAHGDVLLAAKAGHMLVEGVGVDRDGNPTRDPQKIIDGGALLPFGGHKGFLIALMGEALSAALTGSRFGFEDTSMNFPGAQTSNAGQTLILIDPQRTAGDGFALRVEELLEALADAGISRLPGDRRYRQRETAARNGIPVADEFLKLLER